MDKKTIGSSSPRLPTRDSMCDEEFDAMMEQGYSQAIAGEGRELDAAFRELQSAFAGEAERLGLRDESEVAAFLKRCRGSSDVSAVTEMTESQQTAQSENDAPMSEDKG